MCEEVPRQKAAESRKIPESGSVIPREGVESSIALRDSMRVLSLRVIVIPREGVESVRKYEHLLGEEEKE